MTAGTPVFVRRKQRPSRRRAPDPQLIPAFLTQVAVQALSSASGISRADVSRAPIGALTRFVSAVACAPVVTSVVDPLRVPP